MWHWMKYWYSGWSLNYSSVLVWLAALFIALYSTVFLNFYEFSMKAFSSIHESSIKV